MEREDKQPETFIVNVANSSIIVYYLFALVDAYSGWKVPDIW